MKIVIVEVDQDDIVFLNQVAVRITRRRLRNDGLDLSAQVQIEEDRLPIRVNATRRKDLSEAIAQRQDVIWDVICPKHLYSIEIVL